MKLLPRTGTAEGHLVVFDRTMAKTWKVQAFVRPEPAVAPELRLGVAPN